MIRIRMNTQVQEPLLGMELEMGVAGFCGYRANRGNQQADPPVF